MVNCISNADVGNKIVGYITNSCICNTCVTWQGIAHKLPEDDTTVPKNVGMW